MKIVYIGASQYSRICLDHLVKSNADVVGVCTSKSFAFNSDHLDLSDQANSLGIPVLATSDINSGETLNWIRSLEPDIIFCWGWSRLLKRPLLDLAPMGVLGYHPARLPDHRGRHPITWALVLGLHETGSSFFFMDEGADTGPILNRKLIAIGPDDDAGTLYQRMSQTMVSQIDEFLPQLLTHDYCVIQQDLTQGRHWRKRGGRDAEIDWRMDAVSIANLVRGLARPYIGAYFFFEDREYRVWRCCTITTAVSHSEPGLVLEVTSEGPVISTACEAIRILEISPDLTIHPGQYIHPRH